MATELLAPVTLGKLRSMLNEISREHDDKLAAVLLSKTRANTAVVYLSFAAE